MPHLGSCLFWQSPFASNFESHFSDDDDDDKGDDDGDDDDGGGGGCPA